MRSKITIILVVVLLTSAGYRAYAFTSLSGTINRSYDYKSIEATTKATKGFPCTMRGTIVNKTSKRALDLYFRVEAHARDGLLWNDFVNVKQIEPKGEHPFRLDIPCDDTILNVKIFYVGSGPAEGCCSDHGGIDFCDESSGRYRCFDGSLSASCKCE